MISVMVIARSADGPAILRTAAREDLVIADAVVATVGGGYATARPIPSRPRRATVRNGYGAIATFRTPSSRLLKSR